MDRYNLLLLFAMSVHLSVCPYTKVEESFNLQAMHDILYHVEDLDSYDHQEFSGVVPRTFIGSLCVAGPLIPVRLLLQYFELPKLYMQFVCRFTLGFLVWCAFTHLRTAVRRFYGEAVSKYFLILTISQFHFVFYSTRTLPNTFALVLFLFAFSYWIQDRIDIFIYIAGFTVVVFRAELCGLFGPMICLSLLERKVSLKQLLSHACITGACSLLLTFVIDSVFWGRPLWPEGELLIYNVIQNRSSNFGVSPLMWYFYSVLPRSLGLAIFLVPVGSWADSRMSRLLLPVGVFVAAYSLLPHKELRFIIYSLPVFNTVAARGCQALAYSWRKSSLGAMTYATLLSAIVTNVIMSMFLLLVSSKNYPGGSIMTTFNEQTYGSRIAQHLYVCNLAAQTGVTRFFESDDGQTLYSKWNIEDPNHYDRFTHVIVDVESSNTLIGQFPVVLATQRGFSHLTVRPDFPYLSLQEVPLLVLMGRGDHVVVELNQNQQFF